MRHLERLPLGTPYPAIVAHVSKLFAEPPLAGAVLAVDYTGVGRPVLDMLRLAKIKARLVPITITAGSSAAPDDQGGWHIAKGELVSVLQVLLQSRRLKIAASLPEAHVLVKELENFRIKITAAANEVFGAREGQHDDLVLAAGCAAWLGEHILLEPWRLEVIGDNEPLRRIKR
jgi:hypothetical protein